MLPPRARDVKHLRSARLRKRPNAPYDCRARCRRPSGECVQKPAGGCTQKSSGRCAQKPSGGCVQKTAGRCVQKTAGRCVQKTASADKFTFRSALQPVCAFAKKCENPRKTRCFRCTVSFPSHSRGGAEAPPLLVTGAVASVVQFCSSQVLSTVPVSVISVPFRRTVTVTVSPTRAFSISSVIWNKRVTSI